MGKRRGRISRDASSPASTQVHDDRGSRPTWMFAWGDISGIGGTEARMIEAIPLLKERGIEVVSVARSSREDSAFVRRLRGAGAEVQILRSWLEYARALRAFRGSAVWAFGLKQSLVARGVRIGAPWRLVMARNGADYGWRPWMHFADRVSQRLVDIYLTNSASVGGLLVSRGIAPSKVATVTGGLPDRWFEPAQGAKPSEVVFVMVGNRRPEKNQLLGVKAFLAAGIPATLRVYTDDGDEVRDCLRALPDADAAKVQLIEGVRTDPTIYDQCAVLFHPSLSESLPLAVLEAMARGCFVVGAAVGDIPEVLAGGGGLVVDPTSVRDMEKALQRAFDHVNDAGYTRSPSPVKSARQYVTEVAGVVRSGRGPGS